MSRLLDSLEKLQRLKKYHIEELRQQMGLVNQQIDIRIQEIEKNIRYINTERLIATVNVLGGTSLEAFSTYKLKQNKLFEQEIENLQATIREIQDQLYEVYKEQKQFEKVQEHEQKRLDEALKNKEIQELDEMATQMYYLDLTKF